MTQNRTLYMFALLAGMLVATACEDTLTESPDSYYNRKDYFTTVDKADMAVVGIYNVLPTLYGYMDGMALPCSDDMYYAQGTTSDNTRRDISHYTVRPSNAWILSVWSGKYQQINRANYTIDGIEGMSDYRTNSKLQALVAEAKFLRAQAAFDLVRYWGDVPFTTAYTANYESAYHPRTNREKIYNQIVEDLNAAKTGMAWGNASSSPERATQGAARALLMRVLLTRAGYSLQASGTLTRPEESLRTQYFKEVVTEWEAFGTAGYHGFYTGGYAKLFKGFSAGVLDSKESLFEVAFYYPGAGSYWGTYIGGTVAAPSTSANAGKVMGRAAVVFRVVPEWRKFFEENDQRRDITICNYNYNWDNATGTHVQSKVTGITSWTPAKWRREWMPLGYKDPNITDINFCLLRYADVVLMAAEAYNELGNTAQAWELLNSVRTRSGATKITATNYKALLKSPKVHDLSFIDDSGEAGKVRTALYWERGFELAFEGQRKYDLLRWGILKEALTLFGEKSELNLSSQNYPAYKNFQTGKHELFPIPEDELQVNHLLENRNNPGY